MKKKKITASISGEAKKIFEQLLKENFPGQNVQAGRAIYHNLVKYKGGKGDHVMAMIREGFEDQAEKERRARKGYAAKHKAKKEVETFVGEMSTSPMAMLLQMKDMIERAIGDKKQTAVLFND